MDASLVEATWIWHPEWVDSSKDSAGAFVHFRKSFIISQTPPESVILQVTADTKYRMYMNGHLVHAGPVKGDEHMWFYDEIDISPFLRPGTNNIGIHVLRLYHGTPYGTSFPRMSFPGLFVRMPHADMRSEFRLETNGSWLTALDASRKLRIDQKEDDFLHIYEDSNNAFRGNLHWVPSRVLKLPKSHGLGPPWKLTPRMIPLPKVTPSGFRAVHNIRSSLSQEEWEKVLVISDHGRNKDSVAATNIRLPAGSWHRIELEAHHHLTANLNFRFLRPDQEGSSLTIRYSECYEDEPANVPYLRCKGDRCDTAKKLLGPEDRFIFMGKLGIESEEVLQYTRNPNSEETFSPFHFRTFRFLTLDIQVGIGGDLVLTGIDVDRTHYPLDVTATVITSTPFYDDLWTSSIRTLLNCMHDCYEDCPFYEQLQYAMDLRSSCLFTYSVSGDDRLARQALLQLHSSYRAELGLTASRSPASQVQVIPHFSLFWILAVVDHFEHFGDVLFTKQFLPVCDGILEAFSRRVNPELGLVSSETPFWDFVDWTKEWRPMGVPPAAGRTGYQTFTNLIYAHTMQRLVIAFGAVGKWGVVEELTSRADSIVEAVREHCRIGEVFTDGLASTADKSQDFSQHNQIWAVLSGAVSGDAARDLLRTCLPVLQKSFIIEQTSTFAGAQPSHFQQEDISDNKQTSGVSYTTPSLAMSFYVFRALSVAGGSLYDDAFHNLWSPWRDQLSQGLTTWCEDHVTQRSDCHAWGCSPLNELMAEVAGVRPAEPGWRSLAFKPRTSLFPRFEGRVPLGGECRPGIAHVRWERLEDGISSEVAVSISLEMSGSDMQVPIYVTFPDGHEEKHHARNLSFTF